MNLYCKYEKNVQPQLSTLVQELLTFTDSLSRVKLELLLPLDYTLN